MNDDFKYYGFYGRRGNTEKLIESYNTNNQQQLLQQTGGDDSIHKINQLIKKIDIHKQNFKSIVLSNISLYLNNNNNIGFSIDDYILEKKEEKNFDIYSYLKKINNLRSIINYILEGNILIISNNVNMLTILDNYLNIKSTSITLVLVEININNLKMLHSLKLKNKIKIYFFGNILNNNLINNIINFFPNTKFNNIIIDIVNDNSQIFYSILGIKICKELLINNGLFIQFSKIPNFKDNLKYIYYLIFKCFKYNIFNNHTSFIFKDNMYSLIIHNIFDYNLDDNEENTINELLNNNKINLNNINYDKLFIDYLYIKYLTIYYNLQNLANKLFKTTYNILENKTVK